MRILGPKKGELIEGQRSLHHDGFHDLHSQADSVRLVKYS